MTEPMKSRIVECPHCGTLNRISAAGVSGKTPICGKCQSALSATLDKPVIITDANFSSVVGTSQLPVLLDLWAAWCGPCRMIAPVVEQIAAELSGRALVGKLDVDANPQTASRFGVQSIPTLLILKDGREVDRLIGAQPKQAILNHLQPFL
jgi:thioredoxin 2